MDLRNARAFRRILATRMRPAAVPNAFTMATVRAAWLAFDNIAAIRVRAFVGRTLNASSSITFRCVRAPEDTKAIHSAVAG